MKKSSIVVVTIIILISFSIAYANEDTGNWNVGTEINPLTDEADVFLILYDKDNIDALFSYNKKTLVIRLVDGTAELYIKSSDYLADNNTIKYRFDNDEVISERWNVSADKTALFYPRRTKDLKNFIAKLIKSETLAVGVTPYEKRMQTFTFDVRGLGNAILPYLEEFGWKELEEIINN